MKHVLVLGAGRVARPCVQYLLRHQHITVTVVDQARDRIDRVLGGHPRGKALRDDAVAQAGALIEANTPDVVVNLLPKQFMASVAREGINHRTPVINPSYIGDELRALDRPAREAGVLLLCELGVDPGIDHMSAVRTIRSIHDQGGQVESFWSGCGALPAPGSNTNPLGYKLSWSPEAVVGTGKREARFYRNGETVVYPDGETFRHSSFTEIGDLGCFEEYANADATPYRELYDIPEAGDIYRCTLRYPGWSELVTALNRLGYFDTEPLDSPPATAAGWTLRLAGREGTPRQAAAAALGLPEYAALFHRMEWLGLFADRALEGEPRSPRDVLSLLFNQRLLYGEGERDMVVMEHRYLARFPGGGRKRYTSTLVDYGDPLGETSIAKTTGLPPAIAATLLLEGRFDAVGVRAPVFPELSEPSLELLENEGIRFAETVEDMPAR
ncbi:MAG: saccharopine dehydrogenase NADP-binding domain-containing protein [Synergistales bacterium]|nr:saccharopine dehydrogenase NADP-binding domain-containing protein [Synergistales bacterium]